MSRMTIRTRLVLSLMALLLVSVAALVALLTAGASGSLQKVSFDDAQHSAEVGAAQVKQQFDAAFGTARTLRTTMLALTTNHVNRQTVNDVLHNTLAAHPEYIGSWSA